MDYEHFLKQVAEDLRYSIPGATVEMSDVVKVQGESYQGISVRMNDSPIAASMNLRGAHERLMDGVDYHDILQSIHDQAIEAVSQGRGFDLDLVQDYEKAKERLETTIENYNKCVVTVAGKKRLLAKTYLLNLAQRTAQILVTVFCHLAMKGNLDDALRVFAVQTYVVMGSNFIPIPGAVGISEFLMYYGHTAQLGEEAAYSLAILSRGISFYTCIAISIIAVAIGYISIRVKKSKGAAL